MIDNDYALPFGVEWTAAEGKQIFPDSSEDTKKNY